MLEVRLPWGKRDLCINVVGIWARFSSVFGMALSVLRRAGWYSFWSTGSCLQHAWMLDGYHIYMCRARCMGLPSM